MPVAFEFALAYTRFRKPLVEYFRFRFHTTYEQAEELTQETFSKVFRFGESYDPKYALSTWLWTIARNTGLDWYRTHALEIACLYDPPEGLDWGRGVRDTEEERLSEPELRGAEAFVEIDEKRIALYQGLECLTALQREVLLLKLDARPYSEIARQVNVSVLAVKGLVHRGLLKLKEIA